MNAMILYDEFELGWKANSMLSRAAKRAGATALWNINPCQLDTLMRRLTANGALHDAASAHLIVIAVRNQAELPPRLLNWLETWAEHRQVHDATLAVFHGRNGDLHFTPPSPELAHFADRHDLCFIFGDVNLEDEEANQARPKAQILERPETTKPQAIELEVG